MSLFKRKKVYTKRIDPNTQVIDKQGLKIKKDSNMKAKLGSGARFKAVEKSAAKSGASNPAAVAAAAGIKKYGEKKMEAMAKAGKKK